MMELIGHNDVPSLDEYATIAQLTGAVSDLRAEAAMIAPRLKGRRVVMVNSTAKGGGVAEMLPRVVSLLAELGVPTEWAVMNTDRVEFFEFTKRLHNLIHGVGEPVIHPEDRALYDAVSAEAAEAFAGYISPSDILVIHDPQPAGMGALLKERFSVPAVWRCHIGLDEHTPQTRAAWKFLEPYVTAYDYSVFTAAEYFPDYASGHASIIHPALDPLSPKNRELAPGMLVGTLCNAGLAHAHEPVLGNAFPEQAERMQPDGRFAPATAGGEIGLLFRPVVTQISRWDRLKGYVPLLEGFARLKRRALGSGNGMPAEHRRCLELVRLVLAGPDPASIQDDPEGKEVLEELRAAYVNLDPRLQQDVAILSLPMGSREHNALMVNALQRCSTVVAQNSLREGFGLTATEAMWKRVPVMGTPAVGLRMQIRDGLDGRLVGDPENPESVETVLNQMLADAESRDQWARSAQRRAYGQFSVFTQVARWLRVLAACVEEPAQVAS